MKTALLLLLGGFLCGLHGAEGQDTDLLSMITKLMTRVQDLETKDQAHQSEVQSLQSEVQALNNQIQDLETKDQFNQSEVQSLQSEVQGLKNLIQNLEAKDQSHQSEVQALKNQIQDLETKDQFNQSEVKSLQSEVQALKTQMQTLEISQFELQNSPRVAFHAGWSTSDGRSASWETIKYNKVLTNVGGAYSADTGKFTAPLKGLYVFTFFVSTYDFIHVNLMRNTETVAYTYEQTTADMRDSSSGVVVVTLEAGDTVYVQLLGRIINPFFSGFLLAPM